MKKVKRIICLLLIAVVLLSACGTKQSAPEAVPEEEPAAEEIFENIPLRYATQFTLGKYPNGCTLIDIAGEQFLVVPENAEAPADIAPDVTILKQPIENIYLTATAAMDMICTIDGLDSVTLTGTDKSGWYIEEPVRAIENGTLSYAGKYSAPDYEMLLENDCSLSIQSTMILHKPEVRDQLIKLGIPVLIERSSYETDPLGRMEWVKLYGALLGREAEAERVYDEKLAAIADVLNQADTGKTAVFFSISSNGSVSVYRPGGYISRMVDYAGGRYVPESLGEEDSASSTVSMEMEAFYAACRDVDVLFYSGTVDGGVSSVSELLDKGAALADFKAVQEGNVWSTDKSLYQQGMSLSGMIADIHEVLTDNFDAEMNYITRLE